MSYRISLSTCWMTHRHKDGYDMLKEAADLGFEYVELSHGVSISLVPGIFKALAEGFIKVSSCHNFCPLPPHITQPAPNLYQPSSPDSRELEMWARYTRRSIETTWQVGADRLVTHMGSLFFFWFNPSRKVQAMLSDDRTADELSEDNEFVERREKLLEKMRRIAPKHYKRIYKCLESVRDIALEKNVTLCAENREGLLELPIDLDTPIFYEMIRELGTVKLWHDTGHAKLKERMGLLDHAQFMEDNHESIIGFHLHDTTREGRDHQSIGDGYIDFDMIKKYFREDQVFVLEMSPRLRTEQILESKKALEGMIASKVSEAQQTN